MHKTALVRLGAYDEQKASKALQEALSLTGVEFKPGARVAIKANLLASRAPEIACTTHPVLLKALYELLSGMGCSVIIGDSPGGPFTKAMVQSVYKGAGLAQALPKEALNMDFGTAEAYFEEASVLKKFEYTRYIDDADVLIDFAKLKTHGFMGYTGAVKNLFGLIPGTVKVEYHYRMPTVEAFADMLVDIAQYAKPVISLIDAVTAMEGDGPSFGDPRHVGAIVASTCPHRADIVGAALMGLTPQKVPTLSAAIKRGLCPGSIADVEVSGESVAALVVNDFKTIRPSGSVAMFGRKGILKPFAPLVSRLLQSRPKLEPQGCVGCGECMRACPPKAIKMKDKLPEIDYNTCIRCFCCQELCPKNAMKVHRPALIRLLK